MGSARTSDIEAALAELGLLHHGAFLRVEAHERRVSDSALRVRVDQGRLRRVLPRVLRVTAVPVTNLQKVAAFVLWAGAGSCAAYLTAAWLHRFPDVLFPGIELAVPWPRRVPNGRSARLHVVASLPACDVSAVSGIPVTTPSRTLLDVAPVLGEEGTEAAFDDLEYRGRTSRFRMQWEIDREGGRGKPGTMIVRRVIERRTPGEAVPESVLETKFLQLLRSAGVPLPKKQQVVRYDDGGYRLDFSYPDRRLAIEVDGRRWHSGRLAQERDRLRDNVLTVKGWLVLRFTWEDILFQGERVIAQIEELLGIRHLFED